MAGVPPKFYDWLMPALIGAGIYYLQCISTDIRVMNRTLAVAVERLDQLERRTSTLESLIRSK